MSVRRATPNSYSLITLELGCMRSQESATNSYDVLIHISDSQTGTVRLIYAYHTEDPSSEDSILKHSKRGSRSLILLDVLTARPSLPNDAKSFDMRQNNVSLVLNFKEANLLIQITTPRRYNGPAVFTGCG
jgi:hypothetical protein